MSNNGFVAPFCRRSGIAILLVVCWCRNILSLFHSIPMVYEPIWTCAMHVHDLESCRNYELSVAQSHIRKQHAVVSMICHGLDMGSILLWRFLNVWRSLVAYVEQGAGCALLRLHCLIHKTMPAGSIATSAPGFQDDVEGSHYIWYSRRWSSGRQVLSGHCPRSQPV